jgi:rare lipoprotein A
MTDRMRRKGTRIAALALIGLIGAAPARAADPGMSARLQSLDLVLQTLPQDDTVLPRQPAPAPQAFEPAGEGEASYYGAELAGNRTASGERFNPAALTCAHRSLPLGSMVRVTNVANGRSVVVRVNDRGPFAHSRIIDVSLAAAREIGLVRAGRGQVRLDLVHSIA